VEEKRKIKESMVVSQALLMLQGVPGAIFQLEEKSL
jgi:hypothetical protein